MLTTKERTERDKAKKHEFPGLNNESAQDIYRPLKKYAGSKYSGSKYSGSKYSGSKYSGTKSARTKLTEEKSTWGKNFSGRYLEKRNLEKNKVTNTDRTSSVNFSKAGSQSDKRKPTGNKSTSKIAVQNSKVASTRTSRASLSALLTDPFKKSINNFKQQSKVQARSNQARSNQARSIQTNQGRKNLKQEVNKSILKNTAKNSQKIANSKIAMSKHQQKSKLGLLSKLKTNSSLNFKTPPKSQSDLSSVQKKARIKNNPRSQNEKIFGVPLQVQVGMLVGILTTFGLAMVLSASEVSALIASHSPWSLFIKQLIYIFMGWFALAVCAFKLNILTVKKLTPLIFCITVAVLAFIMLPGVGTSQLGASRWINLGVFTFQPSELAKLCIVLLGAFILDKRSKYINDFSKSVQPFLLSSAILAGFVLAQPDMGTTIVMTTIFFTMLFVARVDNKLIFKLAAGALGGGTFYAMLAPYRRARLLSFINPLSHSNGSGYQVVQSLIGLTSGHIFGTGLGTSTIKWGFLPNDYTDFIFTIIGQELGLIGSVTVLILFGYLSFLGIRVAKNAPDHYQMLLASGITAWMTFQAFINIGAATGALPVTGIPLPLVSYGGTQIVVSMSALGLLVNIARNSKSNKLPTLIKETKKGDKYLVKTLN